MRRVKNMAWSNNVRLFLKLSSQRCQLQNMGSKTEDSGVHKPGIFESDVLASTSNSRHMECLFAKWITDNNSINGTWQQFFKDLVKDQINTETNNPNYPHFRDRPNKVLTLPEKVYYVGSTENHSDKMDASLPVKRPAISPPVLKVSSDTLESDLNACVVRPQKDDMEVLSLSPEIRTSGIYDYKKISCKMPGSVLTTKAVENPFSKNMTRRMSQKKPPKEPEKSLSTVDKNLMASRRSRNSRNNFQRKYGSFETFLKYWQQASARDKCKRHNGPTMVVKKRSQGFCKPNKTVYFKNYYEKRLKHGRRKMPKTINNPEIKVPSKPKEEKLKEQLEPNDYNSKFDKIRLKTFPIKDKNSAINKLKDVNDALKSTKTPEKQTSDSEENKTNRTQKNKSDTYETLEELIDDIDDSTLNEDSTDTIQPEKVKDGSETSNILKITFKKKPKEYKTALRVFKPEENVESKTVDKQKPAVQPNKPKLSKPIPETFRPLRVFNAEQKDSPDEDKSWIYLDELTVKSLQKPNRDTKISNLKLKSSKTPKDI
ncbi:DNA ligase 1 [Drosophila takahashii]|uniref:DNA ligase 1 n=1 Tax=Drosophila takahashii TaxID=29030 RepID=UPI003898EDE8